MENIKDINKRIDDLRTKIKTNNNSMAAVVWHKELEALLNKKHLLDLKSESSTTPQPKN